MENATEMNLSDCKQIDSDHAGSALEGEERPLSESPKKRPRAPGINIINCKYECVRKAALGVGLREVGETEDWVLYWTDFSVSMDRIMGMKRYQRINHFPGMNELCRKDLLARNMNRMLRLFPKEYNIFPKTWCLPADYTEFQDYCRVWKGKTFICKPDNRCQGQGIYIVRQPRDITPKEHIICQSYVSKPFIIDGYKFDLRLYVLVTSCDPLRIFLYNEGLVRFATSKYRHPHSNNLDDMCMHLTNYAINKRNDNFDRNVETGSKRKLSAFRSWLHQHEYDAQAAWSHIEDVVIKTLISAQPTLRQNYRAGFPSQEGPSSCFEILGFDILLDFKLKPWLLEVNHSPSFATDSPLDREVKEALLTDALTLLNVGAGDHRRVQQEDKRFAKERLMQKHQPCLKTRREQLTSSRASRLAELERYEQEHCGGFLRIYPRGDSHKYHVFLQQSWPLCQETLASKAREECSRRMLKELHMKKEQGGRAQFPRIQRSREGRGQQGEVLGERSSSHRAVAKSKGEAWDSSRPGLIVEREELERLRGLERREILLTDLGVTDLICSLLQPLVTHSRPERVAFPPSHGGETLSRKLSHPVKKAVLNYPPKARAKAGHLQPLFRGLSLPHTAWQGDMLCGVAKPYHDKLPCSPKDPKSRLLSASVIKLGLPAEVEQGHRTRRLLSGFAGNVRNLNVVPGRHRVRTSHRYSTGDHGHRSMSRCLSGPVGLQGSGPRDCPLHPQHGANLSTAGQEKWEAHHRRVY